MIDLFSPYRLKNISLSNRIVMAPMTRSRGREEVANEMMALYYTQRATAGLIITEGTPISREGQGYLFTPGIFNEGQITGWKLTTDSVHSVGGHIFTQLWHVGRASHVSIQEGGNSPVSSTSQPANQTFPYGYDETGKEGFVQASDPRALETDEVKRVVDDFVIAAKNAIEAGFDGVELHAANGYLFDQFINPLVNDRTDQYSADTIENAIRFTLEVVDAVSDSIGAERVGIRLSPYGRLQDMPLFEDIEETFIALGKALGERKIAYVHVMDQSGFLSAKDFALEKTQGISKATDAEESASDAILRILKKWRYFMPHTTFILAGNMNVERAGTLINQGYIDLAAFGSPFISNPDLVYRLKHKLALTPPNRDTYYGGGPQGYIDYPPYSGYQKKYLLNN